MLRPRKCLILGCLMLTLNALAYAEVDPVKVDAVLRRYVETLGGRYEMLGILSLKVEGTYYANERSWPFVIYKKAPDQARFIVHQKRGDWIRVATGDVLVQRFPYERAYSEMKGVHAADFERIATTLQPLWLAREQGASLRYEGESVVDDTGVNVLGLDHPELGTYSAFFSTQRGLLLQETQVLDDRKINVRYSQHKKVADAYQLPHRIEVSIDEVTAYELEIEHYTINFGAMAPLFYDPR